jgi:hypothetical protein
MAGLTTTACLRLAMALSLPAVMMAPLRAQERTTSESIQALLGDSAQYRQVITAFQTAVRAHDAKAVAALVHYPLKVTIGTSTRTIKSAGKFAARYDSIITPAIAEAVQDEDFADMMVNSRGVMLGRGEVWVTGICRDKACKSPDVRIYVIQPTTGLGPAPGQSK